MQLQTSTASIPRPQPLSAVLVDGISVDGRDGRIDALDITKGVLVVLMVVYHSLNYSTRYQLPFRYLSFLPPSFILITGFLLSHVYLTRRPLDARLARRLLGRGAKLLALFAVLNVIGQFVRSQSYHGSSLGLGGLINAWEEVLLWGGSRFATFDVLLPIAYLLLLSPALLWLTRLHRLALPALTLAVLGTCAGLERGGECPPNLTFISVGIVGMLIGLLPASALRHAGRLLPVSLVAYAAYFLISRTIGLPFHQQLTGALFALMIIYGTAVLTSSNGWFSRRLITLGQYSLIGYIGQIGLLQIYSHIMGRPQPDSVDLAVMLGVALVFTIAVVELTASLHARSKFFRTFYRAVLP